VRRPGRCCGRVRAHDRRLPAPLYRFKSEDEAIKIANDTEFGLASYFYSRDIGRIWRVAEALEYGIFGINEGIISTEIAPFGGMKESGIGPLRR
jgi:succinate-semialdehyde dehydrogenase/glutarate-semialdehyde dehydrogenase